MIYITLVAFVLLPSIAFYYRSLYKKESLEREEVLKKLNILQQKQTFFIRKMMHEVKTPLSAIELHLDALLKEHCGVKSVAMIKSSARMLTTIYDDIAFHVGKEKVCYPAEWIELEEFIANRMLYFDAMASVKNILLELNADTNLYIHMSKAELHRLVDNTLSNAIKYSTSSSSVVEVIISYDKDELSLLFRDEGIGMSEQEIENLFEVYYRADNNIQGLGLGMSIVKEICDDYHIDVKIQSIKREGTTFIYKFPKNMVSKKSKSDANI